MPASRTTRLALSLSLCAPLGACGDDASPNAPSNDVSNADADVGLDVSVTADTAVADVVNDADTDTEDAVSPDAPADAPDTAADATGDADTHTDADGGDAGTEGLTCQALTCGSGSCDAVTGTCRCAVGEWFDGLGCAPHDACSAGECDACPIPRTQTISPISGAETLTFRVGEAAVEVGTSTNLGATEPDEWAPGDTIALAPFTGTRVRVFARVAGCGPRFNAVFDVHATYPPAAEEDGSTAIALDDDAIVGWATNVFDVSFGDDVDEEWRDTTNALGPAEGTSFDIVSLGRGGHITLGFDASFGDVPGPDFAVFENSFSDTFIELGRVSVSSDGDTFVAFDVAATGTEPMGAFDMMEPTTLGQFAGTYTQGWGSPFDLASLRQRQEVRSGTLDLTAITHVRVDDVVGGSGFDSFGRTVYDPYPTIGSAGFDLDGVAILQGVSR